MANVTSAYVSNQSNQSAGGDAVLTMNDDLHPLIKPLTVVRMSFNTLLSCVMIFSNSQALGAVWITPRLRVKAYALTTSMTVAHLLLSIGVFDTAIRDMIGVLPCELTMYKAIVRPIRRCVVFAAFIHVSAIAVDRYIAVKHALQYEIRVTPTVIKKLIVAIWLTGALLSLPSLLGFIWPDPKHCVPTYFTNFETVVEITLYTVSCTIVVVVYTRIWKTVMHSELQHQQQQPSLAAATTSGTTTQSGRRIVEQHGIRTLWHHRQHLLIRKHRATRTIMVILASFVCLFFPYILSRLFGAAGLKFAQPMQMVGLWIGFLEFAINGFIYAIINHDFRDAFKRILLCRFGSHGNSVAPV